jgi:hypothetical protein
MVLFEAAVVFGLLGLMVYATIRLLTQPRTPRRPAAQPGTWQAAHYDAKGETRVVLQKVAPGGGVVDEHLVAAVRVDDPSYDHAFLTAMATARERLALFEAEED